MGQQCSVRKSPPPLGCRSQTRWDLSPAPQLFTFLLMLIYFQLPLLLQSQGVDDGNSQPESFPGVAVGAQGVHPSAGCRDVLCKARPYTSGG